MQVNTGGGLQKERKRSRMYYTVEMALDQGVTSPRTVQTSPNNFLFLSFLILFYSKKATHR